MAAAVEHKLRAIHHALGSKGCPQRFILQAGEAVRGVVVRERALKIEEGGPGNVARLVVREATFDPVGPGRVRAQVNGAVKNAGASPAL